MSLEYKHCITFHNYLFFLWKITLIKKYAHFYKCSSLLSVFCFLSTITCFLRVPPLHGWNISNTAENSIQTIKAPQPKCLYFFICRFHLQYSWNYILLITAQNHTIVPKWPFSDESTFNEACFALIIDINKELIKKLWSFTGEYTLLHFIP